MARRPGLLALYAAGPDVLIHPVEVLRNIFDLQRGQSPIILANCRLQPRVALVIHHEPQREAATALGVSVGTVNNDLAFNNRTESVQELNATVRDERREAAILNNEALGVSQAMISKDIQKLSEGDNKIIERDERREAAILNNEALAKVEVAAPIKRYETIVLDPPWPMTKIERDVRGLESHQQLPGAQPVSSHVMTTTPTKMIKASRKRPYNLLIVASA
jgi:hypothetical protein